MRLADLCCFFGRSAIAAVLKSSSLMIAILGYSGGVAHALDTPEMQSTLKGLSSVVVLTNLQFPNGAKEAGLDERLVQNDIELKLRLVGIKLIEKESLPDESEDTAFLIASIMAHHEKPSDTSCFTVDLQVLQFARVQHNGVEIFLTTWSQQMLGAGDLAKLRNGVKDTVDLFVNAWLSENPK